MVIKLEENIIKSLEKKQYRIFNHSAVQICSWTKKSLLDQGVCYKKKFYNVDTHSCMLFSPACMWCSNNCIFCWRPMENMKNKEFKENQIDSPEEIVENLKKERTKLLLGFKGNDKVNHEILNDSYDPTHYAISLSGEPTLYPKLGEIVKYLKTLKRTKTIFIVSNGLEEDYYNKALKDEKILPTQFYISLEAPNENIFKKVNRSTYENGWEKFEKNLKTFSQFKTRKVVRMTIIKGVNDKDEYLEDYKKIILNSNTDFVEIKAYMHLGQSQDRLEKKAMPTHQEVLEFAHKVNKKLQIYNFEDEMENSRICLLRKKESPYQKFITPFENEKN